MQGLSFHHPPQFSTNSILLIPPQFSLWHLFHGEDEGDSDAIKVFQPVVVVTETSVRVAIITPMRGTDIRREGGRESGLGKCSGRTREGEWCHCQKVMGAINYYRVRGGREGGSGGCLAGDKCAPLPLPKGWWLLHVPGSDKRGKSVTP